MSAIVPPAKRSRGNPNWVKGQGPNAGIVREQRNAARSLAIACKEAASDEQIADWLLKIAAGIDPWLNIESPSDRPIALPDAPDWTHRMAAFKMFLERRDGMPMQAVVLKAEVEAIQRMQVDASDAIDVDSLDPVAARALEIALTGALSAGSESSDE